MKSKVIGVLVLILCAASCAMVTSDMKKWMGQDVNRLISSWGPPTQIMSDGRGGRVFVYAKDRGWIYPAVSTTQTNVNGGIYGNQIAGQVNSMTVYYPGMVMSYTAYRMFWIDANGRVTGWSWKGM
jgi:hypothetical protein